VGEEDSLRNKVVNVQKIPLKRKVTFDADVMLINMNRLE